MTVWRILLSSARKKRDRRANQNDGVPMVTAIIQLSLLFILLANFVRSYTHSIGQKARSTFFIAYKCKYHFQIISWQQWSMSWQCFIFNFVFLALHLFGQGRILLSQITHWFGNKKNLLNIAREIYYLASLWSARWVYKSFTILWKRSLPFAFSLKGFMVYFWHSSL